MSAAHSVGVEHKRDFKQIGESLEWALPKSHRKRVDFLPSKVVGIAKQWETNTPSLCCCSRNRRYVWNAFKMNTNQQWTANNSYGASLTAAALTVCDTRSSNAHRIKHARTTTSVRVTYNHLPSVHFVFLFSFRLLSVEYTIDTKCLFSMHCSWEIFEPILGCQFYVHVSHPRILRTLSKYYCRPNDAGLAKENGCFYFVNWFQTQAYFKHGQHHFSKFKIRILCAKSQIRIKSSYFLVFLGNFWLLVE